MTSPIFEKRPKGASSFWKGCHSMRTNKIPLFLFMVTGLLSYILLLVLQAMCFATPAHFIHALSPVAIPWFLGETLVIYFPYFRDKDWLLAHRWFLLLISIAWPLLDGYFLLNTMAAYRTAPWHMDLVVLCSLLVMSLFGSIASLRHDIPKERETAFLFSLIIGTFATWEYWRFGNFGYASFFFAGVMVPKLLNSQNTPVRK